MTATKTTKPGKDGSGAGYTQGMATESVGSDLTPFHYLCEPAGETIITPAQDGTDGTGITPPTGAVGIRGWLSGIYNKLTGTVAVSAASLPLPSGASTAAGLTTINTTLGTPMQTSGGSVTANAGTNLNTSALALESGGNLAAIKTNTALTAAGTSATSGSGAQGMTGGVPMAVSGTFWQATQPVSLSSVPLPTGAATAANQNVTVAGTSAASAQAFQGVTGGVPIPISGTVTASFSGFVPTPAYAGLTAGVASSNVALPAGTSVVVYNNGTVPAFIKFGTSGAVAATVADDIVQPGGWLSFAVSSNTFLAAITASGSTALSLSGGSGTLTGAGGGGGSVAFPTGGATAEAQAVSVVLIPGNTQAVSGTLTANAGTNLNTSLLALETGGNLASIKTNTAITAAGTTATSGSGVQGMTGGVPMAVSGTFWQATQPVSAASLPLPTGAALETGGNLASIKTNTAITAAGTTATSGSGVQGMTGGVPLPVSAASLPLPTGASTAAGITTINTTLGTPAQDGTDGTGITQPTGGAGIRGWLSGIYSALLSIATDVSSAIPAGSALIGKVGIDQTTPGTTNAVAFTTPGRTPASTNSQAANTGIAASVPAVAGQYSYLSGMFIAGLGATAASVVACNITNILASDAGSNTWHFNVSVPAGVTVALNNGLPIIINFDPPLQSKAVNTALQVNVGAFGAGNTQAVVSVWGYTSASATF